MGKKRIIKKGNTTGAGKNNSLKNRFLNKSNKRKLEKGIVYINSSYNNTLISFTDLEGNLIFASSTGLLGFKGVKKGTSYAASKVSEVICERANLIGVKSLEIIVKGAGSGRDSAVRSIIARGFNINSIKDKTPVAFNGPRAKKARRV